MLPKRQRLTATEVRAIMHQGQSARVAGLSAKYLPGKSARAAVVVSKKIAPSAVLRNRLRRATYQALRTSLPSGVHVVFFLNAAVVDPTKLSELCSKLS